MADVILEQNKKPGVYYAICDEGFELPVIDTTHPAFALDMSAEQIAAVSESSLHGLQSVMKIPRFVRRFVGRNAILLRDSDREFVSGMTTYLQKLGPENLGRGYATPMDLEVAAAIGPVSMRLRLQWLARMLAEELTSLLAARSGPLHLLNIAGGAASDSINALLWIQKKSPQLLAGRKITIHVLDVDRVAPKFGAQCVAALSMEGGPLHDLDVTLEHTDHDWKDTTSLRILLNRIMSDEAVMAGSSEGGLFEYGTDEEIVGNLNVLRETTPPDFVIAGSLMKQESEADPNLLLLMKMSPLKIRLLGAEALGALAKRAGWGMDRVAECGTFYQIAILKRI